jgi:hypothetical protein
MHRKLSIKAKVNNWLKELWAAHTYRATHVQTGFKAQLGLA